MLTYLPWASRALARVLSHVYLTRQLSFITVLRFTRRRRQSTPAARYPATRARVAAFKEREKRGKRGKKKETKKRQSARRRRRRRWRRSCESDRTTTVRLHSAEGGGGRGDRGQWLVQGLWFELKFDAAARAVVIVVIVVVVVVVVSCRRTTGVPRIVGGGIVPRRVKIRESISARPPRPVLASPPQAVGTGALPPRIFSSRPRYRP